jgi:alpha-beta hydrolase superfamily lysophospholipase
MGAPPVKAGVRDGLAYTLFLPAGDPVAGLVIVHGAGSRKENHRDMAEAARAAGLAAVCFDQRGHGESAGALDGRVLEDVATVAGLLPEGPVAVRGSSLGGYVAILAAERIGAFAAVAICPASAGQLARGLRAGDYGFPADVPALEAFLAGHELEPRVARSEVPLLLLHAEGDEQVPVAHSVALAAASPAAGTELVVVPGGHHRSVQHDPELQARALRWLQARWRAGGRRGDPARWGLA